MLKQNDLLLFVVEASQHLVGFIIDRLRDAPEVYRPGGLTLEMDDFCVESPTQWPTMGSILVTAQLPFARWREKVTGSDR